MLHLQVLRLANLKCRETTFKLPKTITHGMGHSLKFLDIRDNLPTSHTIAAPKGSHYLNHVMIFAWSKKSLQSKSNEFISKEDEVYQKACLLDLPYTGEQKGLIQLPRNQLHLFKPTEE